MAKPSTSDVNGRNSDDLQNSYIFEPALLRELQAQACSVLDHPSAPATYYWIFVVTFEPKCSLSIALLEHVSLKPCIVSA
ncbi:hypothetical protein A3751_13840 [Oleiphilus sp. HI0080]|nr:hypothetical protein A3737_29970 [Oleiphilus sp. HI0065]KZZ16773.1 hypothetical protein A3751_13840 [Oleiphilus sp. HI0080]